MSSGTIMVSAGLAGSMAITRPDFSRMRKRPGVPGTSYMPVMFLNVIGFATRCSLTCGSGPVMSPDTELDDCDVAVPAGPGEDGSGAVGWARGLLSPPPQALKRTAMSTAAKSRTRIYVHDAFRAGPRRLTPHDKPR